MQIDKFILAVVSKAIKSQYRTFSLILFSTIAPSISTQAQCNPDLFNPLSGITEPGHPNFAGSAVISCNDIFAAFFDSSEVTISDEGTLQSQALGNNLFSSPANFSIHTSFLSENNGIKTDFHQGVGLSNPVLPTISQSFYSGGGISRYGLQIQNVSSSTATISVEFVGSFSLTRSAVGNSSVSVSTSSFIQRSDDGGMTWTPVGIDTGVISFDSSGIFTAGLFEGNFSLNNDTVSVDASSEKSLFSLPAGSSTTLLAIQNVGSAATIEGSQAFVSYVGLETQSFTIFSDNPNVLFTIVPEPSTGVLVGVTLLIGLIFLRRNKIRIAAG